MVKGGSEKIASSYQDFHPSNKLVFVEARIRGKKKKREEIFRVQWAWARLYFTDERRVFSHDEQKRNERRILD